jgi:hypothetical protein
VELIKNDAFTTKQHSVIVFSANKDLDALDSEISKRVVCFRFEAAIEKKRGVQSSNLVRSVRSNVGTSFYHAYLSRMIESLVVNKDLVVRLHLQGLSVLQIAQKTHHAPRSVDAYLKVFDAVAILHIYGMDPVLMAAVLGREESLIHEYLDIITRYLKDTDTMREYLRKRGVQLPAKIAYNG